jgi:aerobic carbon-monoxide dehydrogenase small subunit
MGKFAITLMVDAARRELLVEARTLLVQAIREQLGVTGPHVGCDSGRCGACTVLIDGAATKSCMVLAVQADGATITTAAGLGKEGELHPLQVAFREFHALQCGFCTPGMLCAAVDLLSHNPNPSDHEVREGLRGNLCRCTGYQHIVEAVLNAARRLSAPVNAEQA